MKLLLNQLESFRVDRSRPCEAVLIYDEPASAAAAKVIVDGVIGNRLSAAGGHLNEWSLSELSHEHFATEAAEIAAGCNLIIVAIKSGGELPPALNDWFARWISLRQAADTTILCLSGSRDGLSTPQVLQDYIKQLAEGRKIMFFSGVFLSPALPQTSPDICTTGRFDRWRQCASQPDRWGLNE